MLLYIAKRLGQAVFILIGITLVTYGLLYLVPADPVPGPGAPDTPGGPDAPEPNDPLPPGPDGPDVPEPEPGT